MEDYIKLGIEEQKLLLKEVQIGNTTQNAAITTGHAMSAVVTGTPVAPVPSMSQLRTPPRPVRLVTVPKGPVATQTMAVNSPSSPVPTNPNN